MNLPKITITTFLVVLLGTNSVTFTIRSYQQRKSQTYIPLDSNVLSKEITYMKSGDWGWITSSDFYVDSQGYGWVNNNAHISKFSAKILKDGKDEYVEDEDYFYKIEVNKKEQVTLIIPEDVIVKAIDHNLFGSWKPVNFMKISKYTKREIAEKF